MKCGTEIIMAAFTENDWGKLDWQLMQNSAVTLYFQKAILDGIGMAPRQRL